MSTVSPAPYPVVGQGDECGVPPGRAQTLLPHRLPHFPGWVPPSEAPWGGLCHYADKYPYQFTLHFQSDRAGKEWVLGMGFFKAFGRKILSNKADPFWSDWRLREQMAPSPEQVLVA